MSYAVVLSPVAVVLLLTASLVYGAFSFADLGLLAFLLLASLLSLLTFTALGILVAIFAESEATAFLASLVIGLPLLFMSGILFPYEFMPSFMASIAQITPIAPAITAMQSGMIYRIPNAATFAQLAFYAVAFTALGAFAMKKARK
jgi:ABC-type polysaccharide/polyol phosphate export permease